jgi:hypothetical protein
MGQSALKSGAVRAEASSVTGSDHDVLDPAFCADLATIGTDELRARRRAAQRAEDRLSYVRRLAQGRLDLLRAELHRRAGGTELTLAEVIADLPGVLTAPGVGQHRVVPHNGNLDDPALVADVDAACDPAMVAALDRVGIDEIEQAVDALRDYEAVLSEQRTLVFLVLDVLGEELTRRYRTGEADVDALLGGSHRRL